MQITPTAGSFGQNNNIEDYNIAKITYSDDTHNEVYNV